MHIHKKALRLIRLRHGDVMYRALVQQNEINIWPPRLPALAGQPLAETIMNIYSQETAPHS